MGKFSISTRSLEHGRATSHAGDQKSSFKEKKPPLNTRTEDCFHGVGRLGIHKPHPAGSKAGTREEEPPGHRRPHSFFFPLNDPTPKQLPLIEEAGEKVRS